MLNLGATRKGFIDKSFAHLNKLTLYKLQNYHQLNIVNRRPSLASNITHVVKLDMEINRYKEKMLFYITKLRKYNIILRKPQLTDYNLNINQSINIVMFNSNYYYKHCIKKG